MDYGNWQTTGLTASDLVGRPLVEWGVDECIEFIESCRSKFGDRCDHYKSVIADNDVDGELLMDMTEDQLQKLGILSYGHRHHIMKRIIALRGQAGGQYGSSNSYTGSERGTSSSSSGLGAGFSAGPTLMQPPGGFGSAPNPSPRSEQNTLGLGNSQQGVAPGGQAPMRSQNRSRSHQPNLVVHENMNDKDTAKSRPAMPRLQQPTPHIKENQVTIGRKIGSGSVGHVYAGTYEQHPVAIKKHRMDGSMMDQKAMAEFEVEVGKMTAVNHPCIVRCYGMLEPSPGIVMELVEGGSLFQIIHGERGEAFQQYQIRLPWHVRLRYLLDSMYGLRAIHNAGLIHGDFKPLNLLVGPDQRVKVADFGLSKVLDALSVLPGTKTIAGTPQYMAPEVMLSQPHGMRIDVYSVGLVMWEILTGAIPWKGMDIVQIIQQVTQKSNETVKPPPGRPPVDHIHLQSAPQGFVQVMHECWAHAPNDRPDTNTLVQTLEAVQKTYWTMVAQRPAVVNMPVNNQSLPIGSGLGGPPGKLGVAMHADKRPRLGDGSAVPGPGGVAGVGPGAGQPPSLFPGPGFITGTSTPIMPPPPPQPSASAQWKPRGGSLNPPPIFLAAGGMNVLVSMLQSPDEKIQLQAAGALLEACNLNIANQVALGSAGGIIHLVNLLKGSTPAVKCKAAAAIASACSLCTKNREYVLMADGVSPLLELLRSGNNLMQENAANALAIIVKQRKEWNSQDGDNSLEDRDSHDSAGSAGGTDSRDQDEDSTGSGGPKDDGMTSASRRQMQWQERVAGEGKAEINRKGGMEALLPLLRSDAPRVKEAAAAAVANAMADHSGNRDLFQLGGGVEPMLRILRTGDAHAQENATTALWNAMVDNDASRVDLINHHGMPLLIQQLLTGTPIGQELAAGAIWKACANDPTQKDEVRQAIPGLVKLLCTGTPSAQEQAAGALRSACINSPLNKRELNRVNGIAALVESIRTGTIRAKEQSGAALANACANSAENQTAARHAGAIPELLTMIKTQSNRQIVECAVAAIRNLCVSCPENQEELNRCGGIQPLLSLLVRRDAGPQLLEYAVGALWKACTHSETNRATLIACGLSTIEALCNDETLNNEIRRCAEGLLMRLDATKKGGSFAASPSVSSNSSFPPSYQTLGSGQHQHSTSSTEPHSAVSTAAAALPSPPPTSAPAAGGAAAAKPLGPPVKSPPGDVDVKVKPDSAGTGAGSADPLAAGGVGSPATGAGSALTAIGTAVENSMSTSPIISPGGGGLAVGTGMPSVAPLVVGGVVPQVSKLKAEEQIEAPD
eukprot:CAMPEP_0181297504 /NCGR_PEP_ID=MMETSP1101-20121128/5275_1 /TAXON_ID=46948 /ORGANISM="Rhodomonas abbreviata, Strain Caron Lab Isolate" /LENGTH=1295 /DNA_ID=CAMNT_0023402445 /DNA_START=231 /DNA_END=4118 /DNA_ORIENTATION=+